MLLQAVYCNSSTCVDNEETCMEKLRCSGLLVWMPDSMQCCLTSNYILKSYKQKVKLPFLSMTQTLLVFNKNSSFQLFKAIRTVDLLFRWEKDTEAASWLAIYYKIISFHKYINTYLHSNATGLPNLRNLLWILRCWFLEWVVTDSGECNISFFYTDLQHVFFFPCLFESRFVVVSLGSYFGGFRQGLGYICDPPAFRPRWF